MNTDYLGDSYDIVKRFFCQELAALGYTVTAEPMLTGDWCETQKANFFRFIGTRAESVQAGSARRALFLDPDTGVREKNGKRHASYQQLQQKAMCSQVVFAFDQSFSRSVKSLEAMRE